MREIDSVEYIAFLFFDFTKTRYETLVGTVAKKFRTKRKREGKQKGDDTSSSEDEDSLEKRAKRGFIKPRVEDEFEF